MGFPGLKSRCPQGCVPSEISWEESISWPFPVSRDAGIPLAPSSVAKANSLVSSVSFHLSHHLSPCWLWLMLLLVRILGITLAHLDNLPTSGSLTAPAASPLYITADSHGDQRLGCRHLCMCGVEGGGWDLYNRLRGSYNSTRDFTSTSRCLQACVKPVAWGQWAWFWPISSGRTQSLFSSCDWSLGFGIVA